MAEMYCNFCRSLSVEVFMCICALCHFSFVVWKPIIFDWINFLPFFIHKRLYSVKMKRGEEENRNQNKRLWPGEKLFSVWEPVQCLRTSSVLYTEQGMYRHLNMKYSTTDPTLPSPNLNRSTLNTVNASQISPPISHIRWTRDSKVSIPYFFCTVPLISHKFFFWSDRVWDNWGMSVSNIQSRQIYHLNVYIR
jgi:hypothetical protein